MKMPTPAAKTSANATAFTTSNMVNPLRQWAPHMQTRAALVGAVLALAHALACAQDPAVIVHTEHGPVRIAVEVVADDASRTRGLMYRTELADAHGMLFVFDDETEHSFWMKNT